MSHVNSSSRYEPFHVQRWVLWAIPCTKVSHVGSSRQYEPFHVQDDSHYLFRWANLFTKVSHMCSSKLYEPFHVHITSLNDPCILCTKVTHTYSFNLCESFHVKNMSLISSISLYEPFHIQRYIIYCLLQPSLAFHVLRKPMPSGKLWRCTDKFW